MKTAGSSHTHWVGTSRGTTLVPRRNLVVVRREIRSAQKAGMSRKPIVTSSKPHDRPGPASQHPRMNERVEADRVSALAVRIARTSEHGARPGRHDCFWAKAQAGRHPTAPRIGRMLSRKAPVRGVTWLPSEPVLDADGSYPLISQVRTSSAGRAKRKSAMGAIHPGLTSATSPMRSRLDCLVERRKRSSARGAVRHRVRWASGCGCEAPARPLTGFVVALV